MKKIVIGMFGLMLASSLTLAAPVVYNDATGDLGAAPDNFTAFTHLDISSVTVDSDGTSLFISLAVVQNPITVPNNWGKYMISFDTTAGGDTASNGTGRPISMSTGMDYWLDTWVDAGGGATLHQYTGAWAPVGGQGFLVGAGVDFTIPLAALGLSVGDSFTFDVYSSGGGGSDGAVDALSLGTPSITTWGGSYNTGANGLSYTVVPEPSSLALLGAAGLLAMVRRFRRK